MLERALRRLGDICVTSEVTPVCQKAYNAREGIETIEKFEHLIRTHCQVRKHTMLERALRHISHLVKFPAVNIKCQKAYNAREGIETFTAPLAFPNITICVRKHTMLERALRIETNVGRPWV